MLVFFKNEPRTTNHEKGQTTVELTVALAVVLLLLVGSVKMFAWFNERMVRRQGDYEEDRRRAAAQNQGGWAPIERGDRLSAQEIKIGQERIVDESNYPALNIFDRLD